MILELFCSLALAFILAAPAIAADDQATAGSTLDPVQAEIDLRTNMGGMASQDLRSAEGRARKFFIR